MYFSSPSSTRLALGPGRAVLILGPIAVMVLVVMEISSLRSGQWLLDGCQWAGPRAQLRLKRATEAHQTKKELVATEEARTQARRQVGSIAPGTDQAVQPALGRFRTTRIRIGALDRKSVV